MLNVLQSLHDSVPHLSARLARAGFAAGAGGNLYSPEPVPSAAGFEPGAVAFSSAIQSRRRKNPAAATAAALLSGIAGPPLAGRGCHRAAMEIAAVRAPADCGARRFVCHACPERRRL